MAAGKALPVKVRRSIIAAIKAAPDTGVSLRQIARDHDVNPTTVHTIAKAEGLEGCFDRSQTEKATRARSVDCRAAREKLKEDLLTDAERLRQRAWEPYIVVVSTPQGATKVTLDLPPLQDAKAAYTAVGIALDKSIRLEQYDTSDNADAAKSMLGSLSEALKAAADSLPDPAASTE